MLVNAGAIAAAEGSGVDFLNGGEITNSGAIGRRSGSREQPVGREHRRRAGRDHQFRLDRRERERRGRREPRLGRVRRRRGPRHDRGGRRRRRRDRALERRIRGQRKTGSRSPETDRGVPSRGSAPSGATASVTDAGSIAVANTQGQASGVTLGNSGSSRRNRIDDRSRRGRQRQRRRPLAGRRHHQRRNDHSRRRGRRERRQNGRRRHASAQVTDSGTISAAGAGSTGVGLQGDGGGVVNSGSISADHGYGVSISGAAGSVTERGDDHRRRGRDRFRRRFRRHADAADGLDAVGDVAVTTDASLTVFGRAAGAFLVSNGASVDFATQGGFGPGVAVNSRTSNMLRAIRSR